MRPMCFTWRKEEVVAADQAEDFASLLRRLRAERGLTQEDLAERAGLSARGISDLERGVKTRPHRHTVDRLSIALDLPEPARNAFIAASRPRANAAVAPAQPRADQRGNLPIPPNRLLGRAAEIHAISALLSQPDVRLLTLTGTGGTGKTRLALHVAAGFHEAYPDGIFLVSLAPLTDARLVGPTIALTLGLRETTDEGLIRALSGQRLLLVLDNVEHLPGAERLVAAMVASAPGLVVLATSRAPLGIAAEREYPVAPLPVPEGVSGLSRVSLPASVELFMQRAQVVRPDLEKTATNLAAIAEICRRLDGLPLAIELAAARCRLLSPQAIAARLERRLPLLTGGARDAPARHQTLRAALAWSYDLLAVDAQLLFRRLSVFSGGFSLDAAAALDVTGGPGSEAFLLDRLSLLVSHSLLGRQDGGDGEPRFAMLETVREYGAELLEAAGDLAATAAKHADVFIRLALAAEPELVGERQLVWFDRLETEHGNLRAALEWALVHDQTRAIAMAGALIRFWDYHGHVAEGRRWIVRALATDEGQRSPLRGKLLWGGGTLALILGDYEQAMSWLTEAVPAATGAGDLYHAAFALNTLGTTTSDLGNLHQARAFHEQGLELMRQVGDRDGIAALLGNLGHDAMLLGDYVSAIESCTTSLAIYRDIGSAHGIASMLSELGQAMLLDGRLANAARFLREGILHAEELGNNIYRIYFLLSLSVLATREDQWQRAAHLFGALDALTALMSYTFPPFHRSIAEDARALVRGQLGEEAYAIAVATGTSMTATEVTALAVASDRAGSDIPSRSQQGRLRETGMRLGMMQG